MPSINAPLARFHDRVFANCCFHSFHTFQQIWLLSVLHCLVIYSFTKFCKVLQRVKIIVFSKVLKWDLC